MQELLQNVTVKEVQEYEVLTAKIISMAVLGIVSFILGILPLHLTKLISIKSVDGDKNMFISLLLCFGGGVLLFTTFIHLQPEVRESFAQLEASHAIPNIGNGIPISELVFCFGFFFVYLIEEIVHVCLHKKIENGALHRSLSIRCSGKKDSGLSIPRVTLNKFDDGNISFISTSNKELLNSQSTISEKNSEHGHSHFQTSIKNSFSGFLAVMALSFHAVFEGLAVGLEGSAKNVWYLFTAIATHKFVIGFCVGIELVTSKTKLMLLILYIGTFALVTPLGIGIGILLSESSGSQVDVISVVLQGMAAGTLLYVVFFEVLARERSNSHSGIWQLLAIIVGFAVMIALQILTGHEHNHGGGSGGDHHGHHHHQHGLEEHDHSHHHH